MEVWAERPCFAVTKLKRFFRDARCGRFEAANTFLTGEIVDKPALGIDFGEAPRWVECLIVKISGDDVPPSRRDSVHSHPHCQISTDTRRGYLWR
jgi:hypothetical protein